MFIQILDELLENGFSGVSIPLVTLRVLLFRKGVLLRVLVVYRFLRLGYVIRILR